MQHAMIIMLRHRHQEAVASIVSLLYTYMRTELAVLLSMLQCM